MSSNLNIPSPTPDVTPSKKSILLPLGVGLILLGLFVPAPLTQAAVRMTPGTLRTIALVSTDVFRLCFFAGIICAIIGFLRRRKANRPVSEPGSAA